MRSVKMVKVVRVVNVLSQGGPFVVASADLVMTCVVYDGGGDDTQTGKKAEKEERYDGGKGGFQHAV